MTHLVDLLDLRPGHHHNVTMLHSDLEYLLVAGFSLLQASWKEELRVALGPEAHGGGRAEREGSNDRAKLALAIIVVLFGLRVNSERQNTFKSPTLILSSSM